MRLATEQEREQYFERKAIGRKATEQNGRLDYPKVYRVDTRQQLADWLNQLARKVHIERTPLNPGGYFATADNIG